ncbi:hypothetical protein SAMN05444161_4286 [Rhizobiales bacterium GAS191]|nr:hypothetical protein SAMN05519103_03579 [Rhizobiales bacterium GAS113]SED88391.1 hypothetical protein SAMN05444161_4286 [Rhizobiales bacterium GAS191]
MKLMRRSFRYAALILALALASGPVTLANAQESFWQRFIRAGAPPSKAARPPTTRRPSSANQGTSHVVHRAPSVREAAPAEEQIKTKTTPSTAILVLGDALADKLAQGIDQEFADNPDIQLVRKTKSVSSLTRLDVYDWVEGARAATAGPQRYDVAVILIGINDWQPMQNGSVTLEPGSEAWKEVYGKRVEALLAVFKEKNIPVVWVGLPVMSFAKFSEQLQGLNGIVREAVHGRGQAFVDLHDAFIDENGKYTDTGPAMNGAIVKLRTSDGVSFTKAGALKAAYFADVEVKRILADRPAAAPDAVVASPALPGAAPAPSAASSAAPSKADVERLIDLMAGTPPAADAVPLIAKLPERPIVGPVISLTTPERASDGQLVPPAAARPVAASFAADPLRAAKPGRTDDFTWRQSP